MALCIGTYPIQIALLIRTQMKNNKSRNVSLRFRGRGYRYEGKYNDTLPLDKAESIAIYVEQRKKPSERRLN